MILMMMMMMMMLIIIIQSNQIILHLILNEYFVNTKEDMFYIITNCS